jgi:hypothetical protein
MNKKSEDEETEYDRDLKATIVIEHMQASDVIHDAALACVPEMESPTLR